MILEADKGKRFVCTNKETYKAMARDHTIKDRVATVEEVRACQRVLSTMAKAMVNMFGTGMTQGWRNYARCFDNAGSEAEDAPTLKILPKVHKPPTAARHPASRPVVTAATGISSQAGDVLADFLTPLVLLSTPRQEDQSTEEAISQLEDAQLEIRKSGSTNTMVGSLDVCALYPSLDQDEAAEVVAQLVEESDIEFCDTNWRCVQTFLACNNEPEDLKRQGLQGLVPDRVFTIGRRPGPTTPELSIKIPKDSDRPPVSKWKESDISTLSSGQKRHLLSRAVKTAVKTIFAHHVYQFCGVYYVQVAGGPIGLRLTSVVARIVMDRWSIIFLTNLDRAKWKIWAMIKYVDDVNLVVEMKDLDMIWKEVKLVKIEDTGLRTQELELDTQHSDTETLSKEKHTMELIHQAANAVFPWLEFTVDLPEDHGTKMVPILDHQVWVAHHPAGMDSQQRPQGCHQGHHGEGRPAGTQGAETAAGSGDPAAVFSQTIGAGTQGEKMAAGSGDPAAVFSHPMEAGTQGEKMAAGSGDPAAVFSHPIDAGTQGVMTAAGSGDPAAAVFSHPADTGSPAGSTSHPDTLAWVFYEKPISSSRVLKATSAYTWRSKLVTMNMEVFRCLRNTTRQVDLMTRVWIMHKFVSKLRSSGNAKKTVNGILSSGVKFYYRKVRIELEGGPRLNDRCDTQDVQRKRAKMGAAERWFRRSRGGQKESSLKEGGWRKDHEHVSCHSGTPARPRTQCLSGTPTPRPPPAVTSAPVPNPNLPYGQEVCKREVESTLMVPFSGDSKLQNLIQSAEDDYCRSTKSKRIRVIVRGGDKLTHVLCRNDPWANRRVCYDPKCVACKSRSWLQEQAMEAKKNGEKLPDLLEKTTTHQCRCKGLNYTIQCLTCVPLGLKTLYRGEGARSARQRQGEHFRDLEAGLTSSPMVVHAIEEHGGLKSQLHAVIDKIEPSALYRAAHESVKIAKMQPGPTNLNRCQEWGAPRVPVVAVMGGGDQGAGVSGQHNQSRAWSDETMEKIRGGHLKRVKLVDPWASKHGVEEENEPCKKRARLNVECEPDEDVASTVATDVVVREGTMPGTDAEIGDDRDGEDVVPATTTPVEGTTSEDPPQPGLEREDRVGSILPAVQEHLKMCWTTFLNKMMTIPMNL